jgi:hypothetical protein
MSRRSASLALLLVSATAPAFASKSMTVGEFDQWLASEQGKSDAKIARQIPAMELSERASAARLAQWETESPGPHTRQALIAFADASRFLPPPPAEISQKAAPDLTAQQTMLSMAVEYVSRILPKLPDFSATRETMHFEDELGVQLVTQSGSVQGLAAIGVHAGPPSAPTLRSLPAEPMHFVSQSGVAVTYRNGLEVPRDAKDKKSLEMQAAEGFTTSGEFGPILSIIVEDAINSDVRWGYWEQDSAGSEAVFRYTVPQEHSHFTVALPNAQQTVTFSPAYHGEIALDPATGSILRLTLVSDAQPPYQRVQIDISVEYAPVVIGDRSYICPVKGVAVSKIPVTTASADAKSSVSVKTRLNDVSFTHYHLFRAEATILP